MTGIERLAEFMRERGLSQTAFAALAGVPAPMVSMWLSGRRRPGLASALKIESATAGAVRASAWLGAGGDEPAVAPVSGKRKPRRSRRRRHARSVAQPAGRA